MLFIAFGLFVVVVVLFCGSAHFFMKEGARSKFDQDDSPGCLGVIFLVLAALLMAVAGTLLWLGATTN